MERLRVSDVMSAYVVTVDEEATFKDVARTMDRYGVSSLPVVTAGRKLVGIVTETDLLLKEARTAASPRRAGKTSRELEKARAHDVSGLMTRNVLTARPDEELRVAARRMATKGKKQLPVVDDGRLVGILSRRDVLKVFRRRDVNLEQAVHRALAAESLRPPRCEIEAYVDGGIVTLMGTVPRDEDVRSAETIAASVDGTIDVVNRLTRRSTRRSSRPSSRPSR